MLSELIKIANELDRRGLNKEADDLDEILNGMDFSNLSDTNITVAEAFSAGHASCSNERKQSDASKDIIATAGDVIDFAEKAKEIREKKLLESRKDEEGDFLFEELKKILNPEQTEKVVEKEDSIDSLLKKFVLEHLSPKTKLYMYGSDEDSTLADHAVSESQELRDYMIEVLPDEIAELYLKIKGRKDNPYYKAEELAMDIYDEAQAVAEMEPNAGVADDFSYIADAMKYYLIDQGFDFGI